MSVLALAPAASARRPGADASRAEPASASDREVALAGHARQGDRAAFGALYALHRGRVHRVLNRLLPQFPSDVDDVAAEVFMDAMTGWPGAHAPDDKFAAWLNVVVRHRALRHRRWRTGRLEEELGPGSAEAEVMARRGLAPDDLAILRLTLAELLRTLPGQRRLLLVLRNWAGWSYAEVVREMRARAASAAPADCECGCGRQPAARTPGGERFATPACQQRVADAVCLLGDVTEDPAVDKVLAAVCAAGPAGVTRDRLHARCLRTGSAERLGRALDHLVERGLIWRGRDASAGNKPLRFYSIAVPQPEEPVTARHEQVLALLQAGGGDVVATGELVLAMGGLMSQQRVCRALALLERRGLAERAGWGRWRPAGARRAPAA